MVKSEYPNLYKHPAIARGLSQIPHKYLQTLKDRLDLNVPVVTDGEIYYRDSDGTNVW
jgi:hypothetical protein